MPRKPRIVIPEVPHHVTQRGSRRGPVFFDDEDRLLYLDLLRTYADRYSTEILAYCLMDNHVHHALVPHEESSLAQTLKAVHTRYANVVNGKRCWTGHLWQQRFFSAPLDDEYLWTAIRYIERNPVEAGIVTLAEDYRWSSAKSHCTGSANQNLSKGTRWATLIAQRSNWRAWLGETNPQENVRLLRQRTSRDLPCGSQMFIRQLEEAIGRQIIPHPKGRPRNPER